MSDTQDGKIARERSPSFPFISLKTAIARLTEFDQKFGRQEPPADRVYLAWGMKGDTSQAQQTVAALKAFGLVDYKGTGAKRPIALSEDGRTYLRAQQESVRKEILKRLAVKPRWVAHFFPIWGTARGPDEVCLDTLVLQHKFNENSAPNFLRVYDETISYAGLADSDKVSPAPGAEEPGDDGGIDPPPPPPPPPGQQGKVKLMEGERIVFTEETDPQNYVKLIASGAIDGSLLEAIEDYVKRQRKRLKGAKDDAAN
jgi:hypothetical protein